MVSKIILYPDEINFHVGIDSFFTRKARFSFSDKHVTAFVYTPMSEPLDPSISHVMHI